MSPTSANFPSALDFGALLPAAIVALSALVALFFDLLVPAATRRTLAVLVAAIGLLAAGIVLAQQYGHDYAAFDGAFVQGGFSTVFSEIIVIATLATLAFGMGVGRDDQVAGSTALILWSASGRDVDDRGIEPDDDFSRARIAFAGTVLSVRDVAARDGARNPRLST